MELQQLLRLLQLGSANLPVGAYAFSQGLESAVACGWVGNAEQVEEWLRIQLRYSLGKVDLPIYQRLRVALAQASPGALQYWNDYLLACRETREQRLGDTATGQALEKLLASLDVPLAAVEEPAYLTLYAQVTGHWHIDADPGCVVYARSWLENQVIAATKLLPLGQTGAQQILDRLQAGIPALVDKAHSLTDDQLGASLPGLAISSCHHEFQYSRLFRS